jgi:L-serine deaminase
MLQQLVYKCARAWQLYNAEGCMTAVMFKDMIQWTPVFTTGLEISNEVLSRSSSQTTAQPTRMRGRASQLHNKINHLHRELLQ